MLDAARLPATVRLTRGRDIAAACGQLAMASAAAAGEILVTAATAEAARLDADIERGLLELKGKQQTTEVVRLVIEPPARA